MIVYSKDIDECTEGSAVCDEHATCTDKIGTYSCVCQEGYTGNGKTCKGKSTYLGALLAKTFCDIITCGFLL